MNNKRIYLCTITNAVMACSLLFTACNSSDNVEHNAHFEAGQQNDSISDSSHIEIYFDSVYTVVDTLNGIRVLRTGNFHEDEVESLNKTDAWYGIFESENGYYIEKTTLIVNRVYDPIVDEDQSEKTGWEITTKNANPSILLVSGKNFEEEIIVNVPLLKSELLPGDSLQFEYSNSSYLLSATGKKTCDTDYSEFCQVEDYKLFFTGVKDSTQITELLVTHEYFDEAMVSVIFIGDLDGDDFPDLILNTTNHYNVNNFVLYLSKESQSAQLLQVSGWIRSVGC